MTPTTKRFFSIFAFFSVFLASLTIAHPTLAVDTRDTDVRVFHQTRSGDTKGNQQLKKITDFGTNGASSIATCDLYGDSRDEIVLGAGPGEEPMVKILKRTRKNKTGKKKWKVQKRFYAYQAGMTAGVNVACGQVTKNGRAKIVTAPSVGAGPDVKVFTRKGKQKARFFAYERDFRGGVDVAVAETKRGQKHRIVTASGRGGETRVRVWRRKNGSAVREWGVKPFASGHTGGGHVTAGDVDGDGKDEITVAVAGFSPGVVKTYEVNQSKSIKGEFTVYGDNFRGGVNLASVDVNSDGRAEIITAPAQRGGPDVRFYRPKGKRIGDNFTAYETDFRGGTMLAATTNFDRDPRAEILTVPRKNTLTGKAKWQKYIEVNLSTQMLYAYENGALVRSFPISSGLAPNFTPVGEFEIMRKVYNMTYSWPYAPGNPANDYNLENVKHNMEFTRYYYFHHAYWHNNFGNPMSHGCINLNWENSQWLYDWTDAGDRVWVHN
jgi:lipoprotein-anchoring transpeptidase ErfK/SrfK